MKHIQLEPSEIVVLHKMTLQDLRNCELSLIRAVKEMSRDAIKYAEVLPRLEASLERVIMSRQLVEREETKKHIADDEQAVVVHV